ncbi:MAG: flagellar protein FlgN [Cryobacterium sp.]|nr:flagellar protein FlgN [Oligoflexia bacterium]
MTETQPSSMSEAKDRIITSDIAGASELEKLYLCLSRMVGLHRQLYEVCKQEREAFIAADTRQILEQTSAKELVIETIRHAEADRIRISTLLASIWKRPLSDLTLNFIIQEIEPEDAKGAERFRSSLTALTVLIERAKKLNASNRDFVEQSLEHVRAMKKNVLGESVPQTDTYSNQGQKLAQTGGARLLSTEA